VPAMRTRMLGALAVIVLLAVGCSSSKSSTSSSATTSSDSGPAAPVSPDGGPIGHVFVINFENKGFTETWGPTSVATYLNDTLRPKGQLLDQYFGIGHASLDNYLAQISGQAPNPKTQGDCPQFIEFTQTGSGDYGQALGEGCVYPSGVKTVADQLTAVDKTWKSYQEDMANSATEPKTCRHPEIGAADTPCVDGQPGGLTSSDQFLSEWVPKILASQAFQQDGLLIITFDEAEIIGPGADATACCNTPPSPNSEKPGLTGPGGGRVGALVISARTAPASSNATPYNHYALLCSIEDLFGLEHLGFAGAPGLTCFGKDVFNN
jgi:hypothetical protein